MNSKWKQLVEMCLRVQDFLRVYPPLASAAFIAHKQVLDEMIARLMSHTQDQSSGKRLSRQQAKRQAVFRRKLRMEYLTPLAQIARAHRDVPGLDLVTRAPAPGLGTVRLVEEAVGIRAAVAVQPALFIEAGQPEDFLARLDTAIEDLRQAFLGKARNVGTHVGARKGLEQELQLARKTVDILDTIVRASFRGQLDVLAKWKAAKRVQLKTGGGFTPVPATGGTADENLPAPVAEPATQPETSTKEAA